MGELCEDLRLFVARAQLLCHVRRDGGDARVAAMLVKGLEQVELGVFFDFDAHVVQLLDGRVAGHKVLRAGAEGKDLQVLHADEGARHGDKGADHVGTFGGGADGVGGDVRLDAAQFEVVACVEHAAVGVAAVVFEHGGVLLRRGAEHDGAARLLAPLLREQRLRNFRPEVAEVHGEGVAARRLDVFERLHGLHFALDDAHGALVNIRSGVLFCIRPDQRRATVDRKAFGEAVARDGDDADLDGGDIVHR